MPAPFPTSSGFELATYFEGASGVLASAITFEMTEAPAPVPALLVRRRLIIRGASDHNDDVSISPVLAGVERKGPSSPKPSCDKGPSMATAALSEPEVSSIGVEVVPVDVPTTTVMVARLKTAQHQKEELELNLAESTKKWDSQVAELQVETEQLSVIRSQAIPVDLRVLMEQAQKGAHEVRDARVAECVVQIHTFPLSL
ncbi:uncharacterized protein A4U43_C04F25440 [Asparagus officinalis]|uniref:Uncharacterized protein n=1 Tax=Asparagus officinalis TaxID=4686 RepID=A0A5P1F5C9_ASPOF|nr:uncharacterized protein A4U43_C04F25440 [Asparagus officinalis]